MVTRPDPDGFATAGPRDIDFRVLGSVEVEVRGQVLDLGGPRRRALLALLVAVAGRAASVPALVEGLWGRDAPADAHRTVRTYVSRLRKALLPAAAAVESADLILTRPPGYVLLLDPDAVDAVRFERLAIAGRRALEAGQPAVARQRLGAALGLWRGDAYAEFTGITVLDAEAMRLERLRRTAVEDRIDADLASGLSRELIAELEGLTSEYRGHERLWGQLMLALYRAGRQADALEAFRRARQVLVEDSGMEPSPVLNAIHRRILAQDGSLLDSHAAVTAGVRDSAPGGEIGALLAAGEQALLVEGNLLESREQFENAARAAERAGDSRGLALALLGLSGLWVHEHRTATGATEMSARLRSALFVLDPKSSLALRLRVRIAGEADYRVTERTRILALLEETRSAGDPVARAEALSIAHHCLLGPDHRVLRQELALELIGESAGTGRRVDRLMGLLWHTVGLFLAADPHAERRLSELDENLAENGNLAIGFAADAMRVMVTIRSGRFDEAEKQAHTCLELGLAAGDMDAIGWYGAQLVAIRWFQGRLPELLPLLEELVHSSTLSTIDNSYFSALAIAAAKAGDRRKAASSLARLIGRDLASLPRSSTWLISMTGIVETAYLLGDAETAGAAYDLLNPFADLPIMASLAVACFGSAHYPLGVAALATGELDRAVRHLRAAVQHNLALGHWPAVVLSRARYARALELRASPGDCAEASQALAVAAQEAAALGMPPPGSG